MGGAGRHCLGTCAAVPPALPRRRGLLARRTASANGPSYLPGRSAKSSQRFDYLVVATGLFNQPDRPEWAEGRVSEKPPPSGPWVVDAKAFTDAAVAKVRSSRQQGLPGARRPVPGQRQFSAVI